MHPLAAVDFAQAPFLVIWETTQAAIAVMITAAMIYCAVSGIESKELNYAFFLIVTMYFVRTNHTNIGGIGVKWSPDGGSHR